MNASNRRVNPKGVRQQLRDALLAVVGEPGARETFRPGRDTALVARYQSEVLMRKEALRQELARRDAAIWAAYDRHSTAPPGPVLEVGAGLAPLRGNCVIHSDVLTSATVDCVASATSLPFKDRSLSGVVGVHAFHHLEDPVAFLQEAARVLAPGGVVILLEPNFNAFSEIVFGKFHPERFDKRQAEWNRRMEDSNEANQALSWIVFFRDRERLKREVPQLEFRESRPHPSLSFVLTGGYLLRQAAPRRIIDLVASTTSRDPLLSLLAVHRLTVLAVRTS